MTIEQAMELRDRAVRLPPMRVETRKKAVREVDKGAQGALDI